MEWLELGKIGLTVLIAVASGLKWAMSRIDKKFEATNSALEKRFNKMDEKFDSVEKDMKSIAEDIKSIDRRLSHLEGRFEERGFWESRKQKKASNE